MRCRVIAVNDAYRLLPYADILYACDTKWWRMHADDVLANFHGERWTSHDKLTNDKSDLGLEVNVVAGCDGSTFSTDPSLIRYGSNSGFQAINLAIHKGATKVVLVGFDMRLVDGRRHFFGDHPAGLSNATDYRGFVGMFKRAAKDCRVPILNATPGSALDCWPIVSFDDAIAGDAARPDDRLHRDGAEPLARTG